MVRIIADEFLTEERDRKYYADHYTCCPPPLFILLITLIEVSTSHWRLRSSSRVLPVAICNVLFQLYAAISSISQSLYIQASFSTPTHMNVPFGLMHIGPSVSVTINPLALELDIYSLAHHLCKM